MREYLISRNDSGQRADRFLRKAAQDLPYSVLQKALRTKNVKLNGARCLPEQYLNEGDVLRLYVREPETAASEKPFAPKGDVRLDVVYEDEHLLIINKPAGLASQPDENEPERNLLMYIRGYLYKKGEWSPEAENSFAPALCHRLDRGTEGLVMAAKTAEALRVMNEKIRLREVHKSYLALVRGRPQPERGTWEDFLFKDSKQNTVYIRKDRSRGAKTAVMRYRVLESRGGLSLLECLLVTGRTHQIRVQCAGRGFPLVGDGKYGRAADDRALGYTSQALCAYKIELDFKTPAGGLEYLRGRVFIIEKEFANFG